MSNTLKALLVLVAIGSLIALGLLLPTEDNVTGDPFKPESVYKSIKAMGTQTAPFDMREVIDLRDIVSSREEIRSGRFKYMAEDVSWRFTVPINWGVPHSDIDVQRVVAGMALADPFLQNYFETGNAEDFKQAAFFMLDWQTYHQTGRQLTLYAWDNDVVQARVARLAYILNQSEIDPTLLEKNNVQSLIGLADFHIQRVTHPAYGTQQDTILQTPAFTALCETLDALPNCAPTA